MHETELVHPAHASYSQYRDAIERDSRMPGPSMSGMRFPKMGCRHRRKRSLGSRRFARVGPHQQLDGVSSARTLHQIQVELAFEFLSEHGGYA